MSKASSFSRRNFIKGVSVAGAGSLVQARARAAVELSSKAGVAKNLIFLVADGMGTGTLSFAHYWKLKNQNAQLNWMELYQRSGLNRAFQDTASASSPVTDSAAAASAWGGGERVNNGSINFSVDGRELFPLFMHAKDAGKGTGIVTSCRVTHATPAGFTANVELRDMEDAIALQYLEREYDVILGGGLRHFISKKREDSQDLFSDFKEKGYTVLRKRKDLFEKGGDKRLLGLFSDSHIPYRIDRDNDEIFKDVPSLPEMFKAALERLGHMEAGFALQVEGGRVDHAGHANDGAAILHEQLEFDECIPVALEFIENNPDTLLIVTTDHGTGGCQLNGLGSRYSDSGSALHRINEIRSSFEAMADHFKKLGAFDPGYFKKFTGISASSEESEAIQRAIDSGVKYLSSEMSNIVADSLFEKTAIGWTSNNHTSECVELLAFGPGSDTIPSFIKNHELNAVMRRALGLS